MRVNIVMTDVAQFYRKSLTTGADEQLARDALGAPFAEIMLKPGMDRVPGAFDAVLDPYVSKPHVLEAERNAWALVQLSLRPAVESVWRYARLAMFSSVSQFGSRPLLVDPDIGCARPVPVAALRRS